MKIRNVSELRYSNCNRFKEFIKKLQNRSVTVGIHHKDNRRYPDSEATTAEVGFWQEYGIGNLKPRMWLRIFNLLTKEKQGLSEAVFDTFQDTDNVRSVLKQIGKYQKDRIKDRIASNEVTPRTDKDGITLIDTGQLVSSIDYEVH